MIWRVAKDSESRLNRQEEESRRRGYREMDEDRISTRLSSEFRLYRRESFSQLTFLRTFEDTLGRGIAFSDSPTSDHIVTRGERKTGQLSEHHHHHLPEPLQEQKEPSQSDSPSIMFLMRTERIATSLSTEKFSLSELKVGSLRA